MAKQGSAKARRSAGRLAAVQALYQMRLNKQDAASVLKEFAARPADPALVSPDRETLDAVVLGAQRRWEDIDAVLSKSLADGGRGKVEALLDCILRAGIAELLERADVDAAVIISDYLDVTASFYDGGETKLVNAILDRAAGAVR